MDASSIAYGREQERLRVLGYDPGKEHRFAAVVDFKPGELPTWTGGIEVGLGREDVVAVLEETLGDTERDRCVVAVETPTGIPYGKSAQEVIARGRDLIATALAAERFASIAWSRGFQVVQISAADVRGGKVVNGELVVRGLCLGKSATDAEVKAALEGNLQQVGVCNVHARDAAAVALVVGAPRAGFTIRYGSELLRARLEQKEKARAKKAKRGSKTTGFAASELPESVVRAIQEQGHGSVLDGRKISIR
jgi:hypothetical protein